MTTIAAFAGPAEDYGFTAPFLVMSWPSLQRQLTTCRQSTPLHIPPSPSYDNGEQPFCFPFFFDDFVFDSVHFLPSHSRMYPRGCRLPQLAAWSKWQHRPCWWVASIETHNGFSEVRVAQGSRVKRLSLLSTNCTGDGHCGQCGTMMMIKFSVNKSVVFIPFISDSPSSLLGFYELHARNHPNGTTTTTVTAAALPSQLLSGSCHRTTGCRALYSGASLTLSANVHTVNSVQILRKKLASCVRPHS